MRFTAATGIPASPPVVRRPRLPRTCSNQRRSTALKAWHGPRSRWRSRRAPGLIVALENHGQACVDFERIDATGVRSGLALDSATPNPCYQRILENDGEHLAILRPVRSANKPEFTLEDGIMTELNPDWMQLDVCDAVAGTLWSAMPEPVLPITRLKAHEWLMLVNGPPAWLCRVNWLDGSRRRLAPWPDGRRFAGAAMSPGAKWCAIAYQETGRRWSLFNIVLWYADGNALEPLVSNVLVATRADSPVGPCLRMRALNSQNLALVATQVTDMRGDVPLEGHYQTVIADVWSRIVLCRFAHPQAGLADDVPELFLPAERLSNLRVKLHESDSSTSGGNDERWRKFLRFVEGQFVAAGRHVYDPTRLSHFAYSADGRALATRYLPGDGGGEVCVVLCDSLPPLQLRFDNVARLTWLVRTTNTRDDTSD